MDEDIKRMYEMNQASYDPTSKYYIKDLQYPLVKSEFFPEGWRRVDEQMLTTIHVRNIELIKNMSLRSDDTFVIGFPKSGTTWVEEIAWLLNNNLDYAQAQKRNHIMRIYVINDGLSEAALDEMKSPRTFKTHYLPKHLPENIQDKAKIIYVLRNPKDMLVSFYHFAKSFKGNKFPGTFEQFVDIHISGEYMYGAWWWNVNEYIDMPNIFLIQYETLLEKPLETVKSMAKFLGKEYTEEQLKELIAMTSLKGMKKLNETYTQLMVSSNFCDQDLNFFRNGEVGNWRDYFSDELSKKLDDALEKNLKRKIEINYGPKPVNNN